jgi:hypothetical protein
MRQLLAQRGIVSTGAALAGALGTQMGMAAPAGLTNNLTSVALNALNMDAALSTSASNFLRLMTGSKAAIGTVVAVAVLAVGAVHYLPNSRISYPTANDQNRSIAQFWRDLFPNTKPPRSTTSSVSVDSNLKKATQDASKRPGLRAKTTIAPESQIIEDLAAGIIRINALKDVGRKTPRFAAESFIWAIDQGTTDDIARMLVLTAPQRETISALLASMPETTRHEYPDAEHLVAVFAAYEGTVIAKSGEIQITSETTTDAGGVAIATQVGNFELMNGSDGWRVIVPKYAINKIVASITRTPAPGQP